MTPATSNQRQGRSSGRSTRGCWPRTRTQDDRRACRSAAWRALPEYSGDEFRRPSYRLQPARRARRRRRSRRDRGAAGDPVRGARARRHDAHARSRRGARARLPPRRGPDRGPAPAGPTADLAANVVEVDAPLRSIRAGGASTRRARAECAARARSRRSRSTRPACPAGPGDGARAARRPARPPAPARRSRPRAACTRRASSTPRASSCSHARTSGGTTRWTRSSAARCSTGCCPSRSRAVRLRAAVLRARAEGRGRRRADPRRGRRADLAGGRAGRRPRP